MIPQMSEGPGNPARLPGYPGHATILTAAFQRGRSFIPPALVFDELWLGSRGSPSNHHTLWHQRRFRYYRRQMNGACELPDHWVGSPPNFPKCLQRWPSWIKCPVAHGAPDHPGQVHCSCLLSLRYQVFHFSLYPDGFGIGVFRRFPPMADFHWPASFGAQRSLYRQRRPLYLFPQGATQFNPALGALSDLNASD